MSIGKRSTCPLCGATAPWHHTHRDRAYFHCQQCDGIFMDPAAHPSAADERATYDTHDNDVHDPRFRKFVADVLAPVFEHYTPAHSGLDFGSGPGPVATVMLREAGYDICPYDPFYQPDPDALRHTYDYIICCEVAEHFHHPADEFSRLRGMLRDGGCLLCKTWLWDETTNFRNWFYQNDPTHTFFYSAQTMSWICQKFGFSRLEVNNRVISLWV